MTPGRSPALRFSHAEMAPRGPPCIRSYCLALSRPAPSPLCHLPHHCFWHRHSVHHCSPFPFPSPQHLPVDTAVSCLFFRVSVCLLSWYITRDSQVVLWYTICFPVQETWGSIPVLGKSPGVGNGNPLQCSCLRNPMHRGIWLGWKRVRHD